MQPIHVPIIIGIGQSSAEMLGEEGQYHGHKPAEDTRLMVAEGACGRSYLGREAFIQVRHHLPLHAAAGAHSLRDETYRNP